MHGHEIDMATLIPTAFIMIITLWLGLSKGGFPGGMR